MKQRRRLEITAFRRRTTIVVRDGLKPVRSVPGAVATGSLQVSKVQCPMSKVMTGSEVGPRTGSDRISANVQSPTANVQSDDEEEATGSLFNKMSRPFKQRRNDDERNH